MDITVQTAEGSPEPCRTHRCYPWLEAGLSAVSLAADQRELLRVAGGQRNAWFVNKKRIRGRLFVPCYSCEQLNC